MNKLFVSQWISALVLNIYDYFISRLSYRDIWHHSICTHYKTFESDNSTIMILIIVYRHSILIYWGKNYNTHGSVTGDKYTTHKSFGE